MREEVGLQMTTEQRRLADELAPLFGMRSGVALAFALMANMIDDDQIIAVARRLGREHDVPKLRAMRELSRGVDE